jgi:hypothetical protein
VIFEENMPSWQLIFEKMLGINDMGSGEISEIHLKFEIISCGHKSGCEGLKHCSTVH